MPPKPKWLDERGRIVAPGIDRPTDQTPVSVRLPSISALSGLDSSELLEVAQRYGIYKPWRELFSSNAKYVEQFSAIPPGTPEFWAEVQRITDPEASRRAALGLARGAQRNYNQILATDGRPDTVLVRIGEGDSAMCDGCIEREGVEGTYAEHEAIGLPGSQECGGNCRCVLIPVDNPTGEEPLLGGREALDVVGAILGGDL